MYKRQVEKAVAQTIEQKVSGVENMLNMSSVSTSSGEYKLNVEFNLEKNADIASVEVQNRVSQATSSLPSEVSGYGVTTAKNLPRPLCTSVCILLKIPMMQCS